MLTHAEAQHLLHTGRAALSAGELLQLETHLKGCGECRAYDRYLQAAEPRLSQALRARWPSAEPAPLADYLRQVQARAGRPRPVLPRLAHGWPLAGAAALLILAIVWVSRGGSARTDNPAPITTPAATLPAVTSQPIPTAGSPQTGTVQPSASGLIAFLARQANGNDDLYVMHPDGSGLRNLTNHPGQDTAPAWSPDGTRLAFVSDRTGQPEIFTIRSDGSDLTQITETAAPTSAYDYVFAWAPDASTRLALALVPHDVTAEWGGGLYMIFETAAPQSVPGDGARQLAERASDLRWEPGESGNTIVYAAPGEDGNPALHAIVAPSTTSFELVFWRRARLTPPSAIGQFNLYLGFDWSPDGRLAYLELGPWLGTGSDARLAPGAAARIVVLEPRTAVGGGDPRPATLLELSPAPNGIRGLRWSPDGRHLLYLHDTLNNGCWNPYLLPAAGGSPVRLSEVCYVTRTGLPSFSADGRYLLLTARWGQSSQGSGLGLVDLAAALQSPSTAAVVPLVGHLALDPAWQPGAAIAPVCNLLHTVAAGETALSIAQQYGLSLVDLGALNGLDENYSLNVHQTLIIPRACDAAALATPSTADLLGGKLLAYAATEGDNWEIFVTDGEVETRLTTNPGDDLAPAWSPDGQRLTFLSTQADGTTGLYVMQADGSGQTRLSPNAWVNGHPQWLPDGQQISFVTLVGFNRYEWRLINADGAAERTLLQFATWQPEIHLSPDGLRVAFVSYADRGARNDGDGEIYTMNPDGSDPVRLTFSQWVHDRHPVWSPDGRQIAYFADPGNAYGLWLMNADGTGKRRLPATYSDVIQRVTWSPDSQRLAYAAGRHIYIVSAFGTSLAQLPVPANHEFVQSPAWQP